jgi:hypothetical protein
MHSLIVLIVISACLFFQSASATCNFLDCLSPPWFNRIFIMVFENLGLNKTLNDPNFRALASKGRLQTNWYAATHPSQPNYLQMVAGQAYGVTDDNNHDLTNRSLFNLMEEGNVSWKVYQENYPGNCFNATCNLNCTYARKHNPAISFDFVRLNGSLCGNIVNATEFDDDLTNGTLPQYSFYSPTLLNDGHNTGITYAGNYLAQFFSTARLALFPPKTLIVITFDEDDNTEGNRIYTLLLGDMIYPNSQDSKTFADGHASLLRTVEENFLLGTLGNADNTSEPLSFPPITTSPTAAPTPPTQAPTQANALTPTLLSLLYFTLLYLYFF